MRVLLFGICLLPAVIAGAQQAPATTIGDQAHASLPSTLPELAASLPNLVRDKQLQFGPYSDAVWKALQNDPSSAVTAIPILSHNLHDPDKDVQFYSLAIIQGFTFRQDYAELVSPLYSQFAQAISSGAERTKLLAILAVANLRQKAPDVVVLPVEKLLVSHANSSNLMLASAGALIAMRPTDDTAQDDVLSAINDPNLSTDLRLGLLTATALSGVGSKIRDNVVEIANTSNDKSWRNTAIAGAAQIGPSALVEIVDRLNEIANDPAESLASHRLVHTALKQLSAR